jgi:hypothetical protein
MIFSQDAVAFGLFIGRCNKEYKEDEMGGACNMHGRDEKMHTIFWLEYLKGRTTCTTRA